MSRNSEKIETRKKRMRSVRFKIAGNAERRRLTVFRSNRNIFAQIIDDEAGVTLVQASSLDKGFRRQAGQPFNKDLARDVGKRIASRALALNIGKVVFDRGPYLYHGKVKALADGAREAGLEF